MYFCSTLATDPMVHKQGVASALLKHVTDMADEGGHEVCAKLSFAVSFVDTHSLQIILESSNVKNVPFYEHRGFITQREESATFGVCISQCSNNLTNPRIVPLQRI